MEMLNLLKDPGGERISKLRIAILTIIVFLIVILPIAYYMDKAKKEHEIKQENNKKIVNSGDAPTSQTNSSIARRMKEKSNDAVATINNQNKNYNPMLGNNPLSSGDIVPDLNSGQNVRTSNLNEQKPPMSTGKGSENTQVINDPAIQEITNQRVDKIKRKYEALNAPITLGGNVEGKSESSNKQNEKDSTVSTHEKDVEQSLKGSGGLSSISPRNQSGDNNDQNMQSEKIAFIQNANGGDADSVVSPSKVLDQSSKYSLMAGDYIPAIMISGLNSDTPGEIIAQTRENMYDTIHGRYLLIPKGSRIIGVYDSKVSYMQKRILVAFKRVIFPDGKSFMLRGLPGTDLSGYSGFYNSEGIDNHYWQIYGSSAIIGVITGAMQYSQNNTNANVQTGGIGVTTNTDPSVGQTMAGSLGQQLGQTGTTVIQKNINVQPTLTMPPGYEFNIMITADMVLVPYSKKYK